MKRLSALAAAFLALAAHAAGPPDKRALAFTLQPAKVNEECMRLEAGHERRFQWKSDVPVDFNIHYHEGPEVFYPVKRDASRGDRGTFTAKIAQEYCWMWTARDAAATIEGHIERVK